MKYIIRLTSLVAVFLLGMATSYAKDLAVTPNHVFDQVKIAYAHDQCSFQFSPVDFCDERHVLEIKKAIATETSNFNGHYIILSINEWKPSAHYGDSLVIIDTLTGIVYPLPFDYYSGQITTKNSHMLKKPKLSFSLKSNKICIDGSILVYRATTNGNFCFEFDGEKFTGYQTEYMH